MSNNLYFFKTLINIKITLRACQICGKLSTQMEGRGKLPPVPDDLVAVDDVDAGRQALKGGGTRGTATDELAGEGVDC